MLIGEEALQSLWADAEAPEQGQSGYWRHHISQFSVTPDGAVNGITVLGSISRRRSPIYGLAHWILQIPFRFMGRQFRRFGECEQFGRTIARRQGRQFSHDMVRQVLSLALILEHVPAADENQCNLVIGDGFGVLTSLFLLATPNRKTITVNLTKPLLADLTHIRLAVPDAKIALVSSALEMSEALSRPDINLIAVRADNAGAIVAAPIEIAANICSMQEMEPHVIASYFEVLRDNAAAQTVFYCANKWVKRFRDGSEVRFEEYPWREDDTVLCDALCPWSQLFYGKTPPFYTYRRDPDYIIWHRLARLTGD